MSLWSSNQTSKALTWQALILIVSIFYIYVPTAQIHTVATCYVFLIDSSKSELYLKHTWAVKEINVLPPKLQKILLHLRSTFLPCNANAYISKQLLTQMEKKVIFTIYSSIDVMFPLTNVVSRFWKVLEQEVLCTALFAMVSDKCLVHRKELMRSTATVAFLITPSWPEAGRPCDKNSKGTEPGLLAMASCQGLYLTLAPDGSPDVFYRPQNASCDIKLRKFSVKTPILKLEETMKRCV